MGRSDDDPDNCRDLCSYTNTNRAVTVWLMRYTYSHRLTRAPDYGADRFRKWV